jgi:hypothetical protein
VVETTSGTQSLIFAEVLDRRKDGEFLARILDEIAEDGLVIVANNVDVVDGADLSNGSDTVPDDRVASDLEEGLGKVEGQRTETCAS